MNIRSQYLVFFSATNGTRHLIKEIANRTGIPTQDEYNITQAVKSKALNLKSDDLLILGVPSYQGRVPSTAIEAINKIKGDNTPAIIVCTFGNRDYDDTLLELKDLVVNNGFVVVSAGAFVATHSIFPAVAADRPNQSDIAEISAFAHYSTKLLTQFENGKIPSDIQIKGNHPYRKVGSIPLRPHGDKKCDGCGICVHLCPVDAISISSPKKTDSKKCISCARCIAVCPQKSRKFRGLLYSMASKRFVKNNLEKQPNVTYYI